MKQIFYTITVINILFQIIYMTFGTTVTSDNIYYIFYIFRPEYMIISGIVAFINIVIFISMLIYYKKCSIIDIISVLINIEYIVFYIHLLRIQ